MDSLLNQKVAVLHNLEHVLELARTRVKVLQVDQHWILAHLARAEGELAELLRVTNRLLPGPDLKGGDFSLCNGARLYLEASTPGQAEPISGPKKMRLVNLAHPLVLNLALVVGRDASLAAYLLGRAVLLESGLPAERKLLEAAVKLRRSTWG